jgi:RNA 3'-terminal phosphate cyclase (ATP)
MMTVLEIDGSYGEGGGQLVRTAVALSVMTDQPIHVRNIRANRPIPGLRPQHFTALSCIREICGAEVEGLTINSRTIEFTPHSIKPGTYHFDVGTAGSMTLVLQACLLCGLKTTGPLIIHLQGGTDVRWAPSWDYFSYVFLPLVKKLGVHADAQLIKRGYYPVGGGEAVLSIQPSDHLVPFQAGDPQRFHEIQGIIHLANLPEHIGIRMKHAAMKTALQHNLNSSLRIDTMSSSSPGTGVTLWSSSDCTILGSTVLGEKNVSAEMVGEQAASLLIKEIQSGATLDSFGVDQLLPYLACAPKASTCLIRELSNHTKTNMWLIKQFFPVNFEILQQQGIIRITVR